ncbi:RNA polymerase sigma factor [Patescibacteria group bacterium]|nr:RNA polymerase sigma factor [Patescibacteria group bacterium]
MVLYVIKMRDKISVEFEEKLLHRLRRGDLVASREWFEKYAPALFKFVSCKISSHEDAEEIVQETFINCLKHLPVFSGKSSIKTWMIAIARHEIADYYRKKYAKKALQTLPLMEELSHEHFDDASVVAKKVVAVLNKMRKDYQELLLLKYVDGKKVRAIAGELRRSLKSVEADLFRARKDFKEIYVTM